MRSYTHAHIRIFYSYLALDNFLLHVLEFNMSVPCDRHVKVATLSVDAYVPSSVTLHVKVVHVLPSLSLEMT